VVGDLGIIVEGLSVLRRFLQLRERLVGESLLGMLLDQASNILVTEWVLAIVVVVEII